MEIKQKKSEKQIKFEKITTKIKKCVDKLRKLGYNELTNKKFIQINLKKGRYGPKGT